MKSLPIIIAAITICTAAVAAEYPDSVPYPSSIYGTVAIAGTLPTYGIGADWPLASWYGAGLEYRRFAPTIDGDTIDSHALALRAYLDPALIGRLRIRLQAGAGVATDRDMTANPIPVLGARGGMALRIARNVSVEAWAGYLWTGRVTTEIGHIPPGWHPDIGIAVSLSVTPDLVDKLLKNRP